jgi:hypothetical protein
VGNRYRHHHHDFMGAPLLIALLLALLAGCQPAQDATAAADPHAAMACSGCHNGGIADRGRAAVPRASCTSAGCHEDGGPRQVQLATATFEHRIHGAEGEIIPSCAGCHTHTQGNEPLRASVDACALCHLPEVTGDAPHSCQTCHREPGHVTLTSAGIPVPHANLPWVEIGCVRCHYDVAEPPIEVAVTRCSECHADVREITRRGVGIDLHPVHEGLTCTACHASGTHHVREISSAVSLVCSDCHVRAHDLALSPWKEYGHRAWENSATCLGCHTEIHRAQQQLLLGLIPGVWENVMASQKFVAGMTCRSCHIPPTNGQAPMEPIRGQALACASCHGQEYRRVLDWWVQGLNSRLRSTGAYVAAAERDIGPAAPDSARALVVSAGQMVSLVRDAGGQHNLDLADRLFRESVRRVGEAYAVAGRTVPAAPRLGSPPHMGVCSSCHYDQGPWDLRQMPAGFHEELVRRQRR